MIRVKVLTPQNANVQVGGSAVNLGGTTNYGRLTNKPAINGHELQPGENTLEEIGITKCDFNKIVALFNNGGN